MIHPVVSTEQNTRLKHDPLTAPATKAIRDFSSNEHSKDVSAVVMDAMPHSVTTPSTTTSGGDQSSVSSGTTLSSYLNTFKKDKHKKPRSEYKKQISAMKQCNMTLQQEHATLLTELDQLRDWFLAAPWLASDHAVELGIECCAVPVRAVKGSRRGRSWWGKKPRAEYEQTMEALETEKEEMQEDMCRLRNAMADLQRWKSNCPL